MAGVAPGKNVFGTVGIGMDVLSPNPVVSWLGIVFAEYPDGAAVNFEVTVPYSVCADPECRQ